MIEFLSAIWRGDLYGELRPIQEGNVRPAFFALPKEIPVAAEYAEAMDEEGYDVYYGVLPRRARSGSDADVLPNTYVLWQDIDIKHIEGGHVAALLNLQRAGIDPSILVDSGNGLHAYHLLQKPMMFEQAKGVMKGMAKIVGGDHTWNASRVLRVPGTHNHKHCNHVIHDAYIEPCKPVRLLHFEPDRQYRPSDFFQFIEEEPQRTVEYHGEGWEASSLSAPKFAEGGRNNSLTRLAGIMHARGMGPEDTLVALNLENQRRCVPPLAFDEVKRIVQSVSRY